MDLKNSNGIQLRNFYFTTVWKLFSKIFIRSGKMHNVDCYKSPGFCFLFFFNLV